MSGRISRHLGNGAFSPRRVVRSLGGRNRFFAPRRERQNRTGVCIEERSGARSSSLLFFLPIHRPLIGDYADSPPAPSSYLGRSSNALLSSLSALLSDLLLSSYFAQCKHSVPQTTVFTSRADERCGLTLHSPAARRRYTHTHMEFLICVFYAEPRISRVAMSSGRARAISRNPSFDFFAISVFYTLKLGPPSKKELIFHNIGWVLVGP